MNTNEVSVQDILNNPHRFGLPTFEEFRKNSEKYKNNESKHLGMVENSSVNFKKLIKKQSYQFEGIKCNCLEHAQNVAADHGCNLFRDCDIHPQMLGDRESGYINIVVNFKRKGIIKT